MEYEDKHAAVQRESGCRGVSVRGLQTGKLVLSNDVGMYLERTVMASESLAWRNMEGVVSSEKKGSGDCH